MRGPTTIVKAALAPVRKHPRVAAALAALSVLAVLAIAIGTILMLRADTNTDAQSQAHRSDLPEPAPEPLEPAPRPTHTVAFREGCMTPECHASFLSAPHVHPTITENACDACHRPDEAGDHTFPLVASAQTVCDHCHATGSDRFVQHKARSELGCIACHDPHASDNQFLLAAHTVEETCVACHPSAEGRHRHEPYQQGECLACHDQHAADVPYLLRGGEGSRHCQLCHEQTILAMGQAPHSHQVLEGECLACHAAHATEWPALLTDHAGDQCLRCHEEVRRVVNESVFTHDAVLDKRHCLSCHVPHAGGPDMLRDDQVNVCLSCHDEPLVAADGRTIPSMTETVTQAPTIHAPVEAGNCGACHSVHGANHERLLREINPEVLVGSFDIANYALCFSCHDQNLVLEQSTTVTTRFRDGDRNLHYLHMQLRDRSSSCGSCHAVHASQNDLLIADFVPFQGSDWMMPVGFEATEDGGTCASGCHELLGYSRGDDDRRSTEGGAP